jgi:hypothetical protein
MASCSHCIVALYVADFSRGLRTSVCLPIDQWPLDQHKKMVTVGLVTDHRDCFSSLSVWVCL